jgi:hypothetical protein
MEEYDDDDDDDEYSSNYSSGSDTDYRPGTYDSHNDTMIQSDSIRRVKHSSTGWTVSLPVMVETKYCGCYSWLLGCVLLPFFGGCVCCCPIDKEMRPKKYEDRSNCDSFCDFCFPARRRDMLVNLEHRRNKKWLQTEQVTAVEVEMDLDQKRAGKRRGGGKRGRSGGGGSALLWTQWRHKLTLPTFLFQFLFRRFGGRDGFGVVGLDQTSLRTIRSLAVLRPRPWSAAEWGQSSQWQPQQPQSTQQPQQPQSVPRNVRS